MTKMFTVSEQHYLFSVQAFAYTVLVTGGDTYEYALRDRRTKEIIEDVASGRSELGVVFKTSETADELERAFHATGLSFHELITSKPQVAMPATHPLVNARSLKLEDLADYPYVYFEQGNDAPTAFAEEALAGVPRAKKIATTDRASLSELICAINGYTVTSGILVGISDGKSLKTVPLDTDITLTLGYLTREGQKVEGLAATFIEALERNLKRYAAL